MGMTFVESRLLDMIHIGIGDDHRFLSVFRMNGSQKMSDMTHTHMNSC